MDLINRHYGSTAAKRVARLPAGLRAIESEAFSGTLFQVVFIPETVRTVSDTAFAGSSVKVLILPDVSWIPWAEQKGFPYFINID